MLFFQSSIVCGSIGPWEKEAQKQTKQLNTSCMVCRYRSLKLSVTKCEDRMAINGRRENARSRASTTCRDTRYGIQR